MTDAELTDGCKLPCGSTWRACHQTLRRAAGERTARGVERQSVRRGLVFPHGNSHVEIKLKETELALREGATEIDAVVNVGKVLGE